MVIVLKSGTNRDEVNAFIKSLETLNVEVHRSEGATQVVL
ncbi:MAG: hypothetical protein LBV20_06540, partial [Treponema sp.]|nr:hypothetical protein [Treponema sp.]